MSEDYLTTEQVAEMFGVPIETVRYWRHISYGPAPFKVGRHIRYIGSEWVAFARELQAKEIAKTSTPA